MGNDLLLQVDQASAKKAVLVSNVGNFFHDKMAGGGCQNG